MCHTEFHKKFGIKGNDFQQLNNFIPSIKNTIFHKNKMILTEINIEL